MRPAATTSRGTDMPSKDKRGLVEGTTYGIESTRKHETDSVISSNFESWDEARSGRGIASEKARGGRPHARRQNDGR